MMADSRVERHTRSVIALSKYLSEIVRQPKDYVDNDTLIRCLKSQGHLSKLQDVKREIEPSSLNTLKRIARSCLDGGFDFLDRLRTAALQAIVKERLKTTRPNRKTKIGLEEKVDELETRLHTVLQDLERMTHAFQKCLRQGREYAKQSNKPSVIALCAREQRDLCDELSLMQAIAPNVVSINRAG
jgi:hypothetical protein